MKKLALLFSVLLVAGVASAQTAGLKCVAVTHTYPPDQLRLADRIVSSLEELTASFIGLL